MFAGCAVAGAQLPGAYSRATVSDATASYRLGNTLPSKMTKPQKGFAMPKASRQGITRGILTRILLVGFPETPPGGGAPGV